MSKVRIAIIDSGVWVKHPEFKSISNNICVMTSDNKLIDSACDIGNGHGTAIYRIISRKCDFADIIVFKICNDDEEISETVLDDCLENLLLNFDVDIINISMGVCICDNLDRMKYLCEELYNRGTIIVSAFDNSGSISYPAAFETVIGVTGSNECNRIDDFVLYNDPIVNIGAKGSLQRLAWNNPPYIMMSGNSFACAHTTTKIAQFLNEGITGFNNIIEKFKEISIYGSTETGEYFSYKLNFKIEKAALFPFNKEMHALIRYEDMLRFKIVGVYDTKYSSILGSDTRHILKYSIFSHKILNIEAIDWDTFDTIIIGHLNSLSLAIHKDLSDMLINLAIHHQKNIYSYDDVYNKYSYKHLYCPVVDERCLSSYRMGKLFRISKPVLGIFGTSSCQGKYTLQLELRKRFISNGYKIGQIGTEPNSLLFDMNYAFPIGYNSSVHINGHDVIRYINNIINNLCVSEHCEIILVGSQSSVIPYDTGNISMFPIKQYSFLMGTQPDAVILCINPYDEIEYIRRSINFLESSVNCKVIALSMFPMDVKKDWSALYDQKEHITINHYMELKEKLSKDLTLPVYLLDSDKDLNNMFSNIIDFFTE